jgi:hypothetical protein
MLDAAAYPHLLDAILAAADDGGLLALRAANRSLRERADMILFKHVAVHFSPLAVVLRRPHAPHRRLPLPPQVLVEKKGDWEEYAALMNRWHRALAFTRIADLHGESGPTDDGDECFMRGACDRLGANLASISIPLVRDVRDANGRCPFDAAEWHTYLWRRNHLSLLSPAEFTERAVLHMPTAPGLGYLVGLHLYPWVDFMAAWPRRERKRIARKVDLVFHDGGWSTQVGQDVLGVDVKRFTAALHQMLDESDAHVTFVGWEALGRDDLHCMGFDHLDTVPAGEAPFAVRVIVHEIHRNFRAGAYYANNPWKERITSLTVQEWRKTTAYPDLAFECPLELPPLPSFVDRDTPVDAAAEASKGATHHSPTLTPDHPTTMTKRFAFKKSRSAPRGPRGKKLCMVM